MDQMGEVDYAPGGLITDDDTQWMTEEAGLSF
jgi:hypothetical protein